MLISTTPFKMKWLKGPDCGVKCSRDDFLLDHIIVKHTGRRSSLEQNVKDQKRIDSFTEKVYIQC